MTTAALATLALPLPTVAVIIAAMVTWSFGYAGFPLAKL
jgi:hypothetical protein